MFHQYALLNTVRFSSHINSLFSHAKSSYPAVNYLADETGGKGEDIPAFVLLCRKWEDHKSNDHFANVQQQVNRCVLAVVQQSLIEPMHPLGEPRAYLLSQVRDENSRDEGGLSERASASSILPDWTTIAGLVGGAGGASGVTMVAAEVVGAALNGMTPRVNCRDVLSHIELSR